MNTRYAIFYNGAMDNGVIIWTDGAICMYFDFIFAENDTMLDSGKPTIVKGEDFAPKCVMFKQQYENVQSGTQHVKAY